MSKLDIFDIERFAIHDGPGIRTAVFFQGCPLRCAWCANPESQTVRRHIMRFENLCTGCGKCASVCGESAVTLTAAKAVVDRSKCISCGKCAAECPNNAIKISGRKISCDELFKTVMRDYDYYKTSGGGVTLSGGEALVHISKMIPFLEKCRQNNIHIAVETCGHVSMECVKTALKYIDLFLFDIKTLNSVRFSEFTGGNMDTVLSAFAYINKTAPEKLIVRVPVIPGFNEDEITAIIKYMAERNATNIHLLPYHTLGIAKYAQLGLEYPYHIKESLEPGKLLHYIEIGEKHGVHVKIGG